MSLADPASLQLPRSEETWQVARLRLPLWMEPDDSPSFRPWCVLGLRLPSRVFLRDTTPEETAPAADRIGEMLVKAAGKLGFLPRRLQVTEPGLADDLRRSLSRHGFDVERVESIPELDEAVDALVRELFDDDPGFLAGDGVTLDQVASFAEAAASFARARPWRHLEEVDRIRLEAPESGPVRFAFVLGSVGLERGILFLPEPRDSAAEIGEAPDEEPWLVHYTAPWIIPAHDLYVWERYGLAVAGEEEYPRVSTPGDDSRRPDTDLLDRFEAILRALACTTEDEMDSGRWEKTVETGRGPVRLVLSLPDLLEPPELDWDDDFEDPEEEGLDDVFPEDEEKSALAEAGAGGTGEAEPPTPESEALELIAQAWGALGRRRVALARRALALWPGCADAWTLLAERERDPEQAVSLYSRAVEVAERAVDPLLFEKKDVDFGEVFEAQSYLQARLGLAEALWEVDRCEEAVVHYQELLRLNPADDPGVRSRLIDALLLLDRDGDAVRVLDASPGETAHSLYSRTLLAFRREGDSPGARNCLTLALGRNRFVPEYLLAKDLRPEEVLPLLFQPGDRAEATSYAVASSEVWDNTPGALDWLRERVSTRRKAGRKGKAKRKIRKR